MIGCAQRLHEVCVRRDRAPELSPASGGDRKHCGDGGGEAVAYSRALQAYQRRVRNDSILASISKVSYLADQWLSKLRRRDHLEDGAVDPTACDDVQRWNRCIPHSETIGDDSVWFFMASRCSDHGIFLVVANQRRP